MESDVLTQVVSSLFAVRTTAAGDSWFDGHDVSHLEVRDSLTNLEDLGTSLVPQDDGAGDDEVPNASMAPVVDVRAANTDGKALENDLLRGSVCVSGVSKRKKAGADRSWLEPRGQASASAPVPQS